MGSTPLGGPWPDGPVAAHAVFAAHKEQAVPELSTLLMLVFGLGLIGLAGGLKRIVRK